MRPSCADYQRLSPARHEPAALFGLAHPRERGSRYIISGSGQDQQEESINRLPMLRTALLLTAAVIPAVATNIVANPGFESGLTGWTGSPDWGSGNFAVHTGSLEAFTQCVGAACIGTPTSFLYQDLATVAAQTYALTFWYRFQGPSGTTNINELQTLAGGVIVSDLVNEPNNGGVYQQALTTFVATGPTTRIQFDGRNDPSFLIIDDVCVDVNGGTCGLVASPEPSTSLLSGLSLLSVCLLLPRMKRSRSPE